MIAVAIELSAFRSKSRFSRPVSTMAFRVDQSDRPVFTPHQGEEKVSTHSSALNWRRAPHPHDDATYSRNHLVTLSGEQTVQVSASVEFKGDAACADPEQMLVSAVSSCHMLFFLAIAEHQGFTVESYKDDATGYLEKNQAGSVVINRVELSPEVRFGGGKVPDAAALGRIHGAAHKNCFIGNSITAEVIVRDRSAL